MIGTSVGPYEVTAALGAGGTDEQSAPLDRVLGWTKDLGGT